MMRRRSLLVASVAGSIGGLSRAQQRATLADPLRVGADHSLVESGLARQLQRAFGRDTGIAVQLVAGAATALLEALANGELDACLSNAPDAETRLDAQGLLHDRRAIAVGEFVIVGPGGAAKGSVRDPANIAGTHRAALALARIRATASTDPRALVFLSANDGSGAHLAEQALWRRAQIAPAAPWYEPADAGRRLLAQARERNAYALVERAAWHAQGGAPLALLVDGDPELAEPVHVMRAFRVSHPAGKIFVTWIAGPRGRAVAVQRGYQAPPR